MTKSSFPSHSTGPIRRTARISVKPIWPQQTIHLSSSSSDEFSSPIKNEHFLNLASPTPSPLDPTTITTPPPTKTPVSTPSAPTQPSKTPSPSLPPKLTPVELFGSPPSSPHPYIEDLNDLPPRSPNPLPSFDLNDQMAHLIPKTLLEPHVSLETNPPPQPKPLLFHPIFKDIHGPLYGEPNFEENVHPIPPPPQTFQSLFPSYEEIERMIENHLHQAMDLQTTLLDSIQHPPPTAPNNPPPPSHHCSQCEQMIHIGETLKTMLHQFHNETRFTLQHILERLDALSHPNHP